MNSEIKKEMKALCRGGIENFTKKVHAYKTVVKLIEVKNIKKYLYYPVRNYDFVQFAKRINRFDENKIPAAIIDKLAKKDELKAIGRILQSSEVLPDTAILQAVDKKAIKAALQKTYTALKTKSFTP